MLVITGSPGVGKHSIARIIAKKLGLKLIDINSIALKNNAVISKDKSGYVVDIKKLSSILRKEIKKDCLVVGHLAPYVLKARNTSLVAVIRRSPYELKKVYAKRGYDREKIMDNVSSEVIGICLYDSIKRFGEGRVAEFDSTGKKPEKLTGEIISVINRELEGSVGKVDWLSLIVKNNDLQRFFEYP